MTDKTKTHDIAAEDLNKDQLLDLLDQMIGDMQGTVDTDLRLKALDRALNYQAICAKNNLGTDDTVEIAQAFLAFLKGE